MLKKIPISQLKLGMHLHAFDGAWIDHPFWRTRFVITDPVDIQKARASGLAECWIATDLGLDVDGELTLAEAPVPEAAPESEPEPAPAPAMIPPGTPAKSNAPTSQAEELHEAAAICKRSRKAVVSMFGDARMGRAIDAEQCLPLVADITDSVFRNPGALVSLARLKTHDDYSYMHSVAVCALMVSLSRHQGHDEDQCRQAGLAGLLHDIGKALMPPEVLNKPGKLTDAEFDVMRSHPERGHEVLLEGHGVGPGPLEVCMHHHEKMDGTGYPHKLAGDRISLLARMGAVCDVYDAITSNRPYKAGWDPGESIARMASWKGHFDPAVFGAFVRSIGIYPTGALVRMESGRLGVVIEQNAAKPAQPVVKAFFSTKSNMPIVPVLLDLASGRANDRIIGRESAEKWGFRQIDDLWVDSKIRLASK
jgi:HD-GYP domain-containing protein (c-di-GMP phosphodiesterase class II)